MTFDEWKENMQRDGHLSPTLRRKRSDSNMYPYACLGPLTSKFANHIKKCYNEGIKNELSVEDWLYVCYASGIKHPDDIGIAMDKHHLARIGDVGAYKLGNCRYILGSENMSERDTNGGTERGAKKRTGSGNGMFGNKRYTGTNGALWTGYYHTPKGRFDTALEAAKSNCTSTQTIIRRCKHQTRASDISEHDYKKFCDDLRDKGWWFEEVGNDTRT